MEIEVIGLDGDDTLWHSERLFVDTQAQFRSLLAPYVDGSEPDLDRHLLDVERRNLPVFGYGVKGFTLSLVETAIEVTGGQVRGHDLQAILELGKALMDHPVELLPGVAEAVERLASRYRLVVVTKGDLLHQESKVARSGLVDHFDAVEIVAEKDELTYERVLERHAIDPGTFFMVGNSVRSDVLPVLSVGGQAAHIPYHVTWELEHVEAHATGPAFPVLGSLGELPDLLASLE